MKTKRLIDADDLLIAFGNALNNAMEKNCSTCAWHDSFSWVCFNGLSEHRADFTDPENTCQEWKERKDEND